MGLRKFIELSRVMLTKRIVFLLKLFLREMKCVFTFDWNLDFCSVM